MWVSGKWLDQNRGTTPGKRKGRRQRGLWKRGVEWAWIDGEIQYDVHVIDRRADLVAVSQRESRAMNAQVTKLK